MKERTALELATEIAIKLGADVVGNAVCQNDPECGGLDVDHFNQEIDESVNDSWRKRKLWPVYVGHCYCDIRKDRDENLPEDIELFGHSVYCLEPVPDPFSDSIQVAIMNKLVEKYGWDQVGNKLHSIQKLDESNAEVKIRLFLEDY